MSVIQHKPSPERKPPAGLQRWFSFEPRSAAGGGGGGHRQPHLLPSSRPPGPRGAQTIPRPPATSPERLQLLLGEQRRRLPGLCLQHRREKQRFRELGISAFRDSMQRLCLLEFEGKKCPSGLPPGPGQSRGCWGGRGPNLSLSPLPALPTANPRWFWGKKPVQSHLHAGLVPRQRCDPRGTPRMRAGAPRSPRPWRGPCPGVSGVPAPGWFHISYLGH